MLVHCTQEIWIFPARKLIELIIVADFEQKSSARKESTDVLEHQNNKLHLHVQESACGEHTNSTYRHRAQKRIFIIVLKTRFSLDAGQTSGNFSQKKIFEGILKFLMVKWAHIGYDKTGTTHWVGR